MQNQLKKDKVEQLKQTHNSRLEIPLYMYMTWSNIMIIRHVLKVDHISAMVGGLGL
jgi:hypothetical protein